MTEHSITPPTKHELFKLLVQTGGAIRCVSIEWIEPFALAVLARWGRQTAPVPVSERLPGPEDCDEQGRCWMFGKIEGDWRLVSTINPGVPKLKYCFSHWLPANALPLPAGEVQP